jgi:hypothetical protein
MAELRSDSSRKIQGPGLAELAEATFGFNPDPLLEFHHFLIESSHSHFAHDAIGLRRITAVYDVSFLLEGQDRCVGLGAKRPVCIDRGVIEAYERDLDPADVFSYRTLLRAEAILGTTRKSRSDVSHTSRCNVVVAPLRPACTIRISSTGSSATSSSDSKPLAVPSATRARRARRSQEYHMLRVRTRIEICAQTY